MQYQNIQKAIFLEIIEKGMTRGLPKCQVIFE